MQAANLSVGGLLFRGQRPKASLLLTQIFWKVRTHVNSHLTSHDIYVVKHSILLRKTKMWRPKAKTSHFNGISSCLIRLDAEIQRSLCLVRVPLNVEDTLSCYQQALERRPHCLLVFQRSRALLLRLLANTVPCELSTDGADADILVQLQLGTHTSCLSTGFAAPFHHFEGQRQVKFDPSLDDVPSVQSLDLYEDFSKLSAVCKLPVSPDNMTTVTDAFSATISKRFCK